MFKNLILSLFMFLLMVPNSLAYAQQDSDPIYEFNTQEYEQLYKEVEENLKDLEKEYGDTPYNYSDEYPNDAIIDSLSKLEGNDFDSQLGALGAGIIILAIIISGVMCLALYVFTSWAYMAIANRLKEENAWFAWVPVLNLVLIAKLGDVNPLHLLLLIIPGVNIIYAIYFSIVTSMRMTEKLGLDKYLGLLIFIPVVQLFFLGYLAWGKFGKVNE